MKLFEEKDGVLYINLCTTESNEDWIRAGRLVNRKDNRSQKEYQRMENQEMTDGKD